MSKLKTIHRILTLTCDESTRLVSESLDRELPLGDRLAVRLHAMICRSCRRVRRQFLALRDAVRRAADEPGTGDGPHEPALSPEARARIAEVLQRRTDR